MGLPEGVFPIVEATLYLATAQKSNSSLGYFSALKEIEQNGAQPVPTHLMDGNRDSKAFGHGKGYQYPHEFPDHFVGQQYLPASLMGKTFYQPSEQGREKLIAEKVALWREIQSKALQEQFLKKPET